MESFWDRVGIVLGSFWDSFGIIWDRLGAFWDRVGVVLVSFWDRFGISFGYFFPKVPPTLSLSLYIYRQTPDQPRRAAAMLILYSTLKLHDNCLSFLKALDLKICDVTGVFRQYPNWSAVDTWHTDALAADVVAIICFLACKTAASRQNVVAKTATNAPDLNFSHCATCGVK